MQSIIDSARIGESYQRIEHPSGLTILLYPMQGYSSAYALFATKYGSIDTCFKTTGDADFLQVPEGCAHFLEHKLFESEEGDAFTRYAKTGASANAYTSFDRTAYLFSCTENFKESLDILLDFVTHPYFTQATVEKEQGIIGQEIKMYDDNPDWRVFFNLLCALYKNNPVRIDIAGTVESIAKIDAETLYRCYNTFYNLHNMALVVAGNFEVETVLEAADRILAPAKDTAVERKSAPEPRGVCKEKTVQYLPVAQPLFQIGFKAVPSTEIENLKNQIKDEVLLDIVAGEASPLYRRLYDEGLINQTFGTEAMVGRDYVVNIFAGESRNPEKVFDEIKAEIERLGRDGIDEASFSRCKKAAYGRYIAMLGNVQAVAGLLLNTHLSGLDAYALLDETANMTLDDMTARLRDGLDTAHCAISIVKSEK